MDNIAIGVNGRECFAGRTAAWHGKGIVRPEGWTRNADGSAIDHLLTDADIKDIRIGKQKIYIMHANKLRKVEGGWAALVREDTGDVFGVVKKRYAVLQNLQGFRIADALIDAGVAEAETAGSIRNGARSFVTLKFSLPDETLKALGDGILPYGVISLDHAAKQRVIVQNSPLVVVCENTLHMAQSAAFGGTARYIALRHDNGIEGKLESAVTNLWGGIIEQYGTMAKQYDLMRRTSLNEAEFNASVLDAILAIPDKLVKGTTKREQTSLGKLRDKRDMLTDLWNGNAKGLSGGDDPLARTAWAAYQGVTEAVQHDRTHFKAQGFRDASVMFGRLAQMQDVVLDNLVDLCVAKTEESLVDRIVESGGGNTLLDAIVA